jgi:hypothetical protein
VLLSVGSAAGVTDPTPLEITTCGVVVDKSVRAAFLSSDLDCSSFEGMDTLPAVWFLGRTTFDLRGFTLMGSTTALSGGTMVRCERNCSIVGNGGRIIGGIRALEVEKKLYAADVTLRDTVQRSIDGNGRVELVNVTISGSRVEALSANRRALIRNSTITGNGGIPQPDGRMKSSSAVVFGGRVEIYDSIIADNQWAGVEGYRIRVENSTVMGNGLHSTCGVTRNCKFDIGSHKQPRVENLQCERSLDMTSCECTGHSPYVPEIDPALNNWGICTLD